MHWWIGGQVDQQVLRISKQWGPRQRPPAHSNGGSCKHESKGNQNSNTRSFFRRFHQKTSWRRRIPSPHLESEIHASLYSYICNSILLKVAQIDIALQELVPGLLCFLFFVLSSFPHTSNTSQEKRYVRHNARKLLMVTRNERWPRICAWMSLMRREWVLSDAQAESLAFQSCRTPWVRGNWQFGSATEDNDQISTYSHNNRPNSRNWHENTHSKDQSDTGGNTIPE